jgi:CDP-paratose 2-epimerase
MPSILITGGAGFIGVNTASHFARKGWKVIALDNLSRRGANENLGWLKANATIAFEEADVRDVLCLEGVLERHQPDVVVHLAGQVAVTTSLANPREDFEINALGTLNLLEAVRLKSPGSFVIFSSTNKVYGRMEDVGIEERETRYEFRAIPQGVSEKRRLDFHSPYGCSKGAADQYTLDYHKSYGLKTVTFRQSCIYGPHQFGVEDQGWVAWFIIAALLDRPITIYGDGKQVRDVLHVDDLARLYETAAANPDISAGRAYNIGGGPENAISLLELLALLEKRLGRPIPRAKADWRRGDQPVYVSDLSRVSTDLGWRPSIPWEKGIGMLADWVEENRGLF